jgi:2-polyprenyl-3-methyl-5-hydroxy-6-metoxy-1,4-benzoquinol methylase
MPPSRADPSRATRVLDLGCSVGAVAARLHDIGAIVVGVDTNDRERKRTRLQ